MSIDPGPASVGAYTYDGNGYVASFTDEEGRPTSYVNDATGRPTSVTRGSGTAQAATTTTTWDPTYNVATQIVEPGRSTSQILDANGFVVQRTITDPIGGQQSFVYDNARRVTSVTNSAGEVVTYTRDAMGDATSVTVKNATPATTYAKTRTFDELGRLIKEVGAAPANSTTQFGYDRMNRTLKEATVKRFHYETNDQLRSHLSDFEKPPEITSRSSRSPPQSYGLDKCPYRLSGLAATRHAAAIAPGWTRL